ncbi:MAG: T9SS type A sorting domain-containing protein, partial [Candidatus Zixiibacteriota bacterium]
EAADYPHSVFAVDLDGDGDNDLGVANYWSANISVLLNNGDGTFQAAFNYGTWDGPRSVFAVDLDNDGDNDLAVANYGSEIVSVHLNNGDGTFHWPVDYWAGHYPWSVFAADLDGDGDNDLAVVNYGSENVSVFLNNGYGAFPAGVNYGAGSWPASVFAADLDGDGDNDLAVANSESNDISILFNLSNITDVEDSPVKYLPMSFYISQNYPNPFNAATNISFSLPQAGEVKIVVYDLLGRVVDIPLSEFKEAGNHSVTWKADRYTSGIYFYRLETADGSYTQRMTLLK